MNTGLSNLIFSEKISESVKLELITRVLEKTSPEMIVEHLFSHSNGKDDYVYVLENIPRVGVFRDIKKAFWGKINTLDETLIYEVSNEYIRKAALNVLNKREAAANKAEKNISTKGFEPVGLAAINRLYEPADKARAAANKAKKALIYTNDYRNDLKAERLKKVKERASNIVANKPATATTTATNAATTSKPAPTPTANKTTAKPAPTPTANKPVNATTNPIKSKPAASNNGSTKRQQTIDSIKNVSTAIKNGEKLPSGEYKEGVGSAETEATRKGVHNKLNGTSNNKPEETSSKPATDSEVKNEENSSKKDSTGGLTATVNNINGGTLNTAPAKKDENKGESSIKLEGEGSGSETSTEGNNKPEESSKPSGRGRRKNNGANATASGNPEGTNDSENNETSVPSGRGRRKNNGANASNDSGSNGKPNNDISSTKKNLAKYRATVTRITNKINARKAANAPKEEIKDLRAQLKDAKAQVTSLQNTIKSAQGK